MSQPKLSMVGPNFPMDLGEHLILLNPSKLQQYSVKLLFGTPFTSILLPNMKQSDSRQDSISDQMSVMVRSDTFPSVELLPNVRKYGFVAQ